MPPDQARTSVLGAVWAESERWEVKRFGFLGLRAKPVVAAPLRFLDWTIDGQPLRDRMAFPDGTVCREITFLTEGSEGDRYAIESLRVLLGEREAGADPWVRYSDGRAGVLFCEQCGGLDCGAVTAEVVVGDSHVEWRDIAYQNVPELLGDVSEMLGTDEVPAFTLRFDRRSYESTVADLLAQWSGQGTS
jgi:hypothetical protein